MISESACIFGEIGPRHSIRPLRLLVQKYHERIIGNKLALPKFIWLELLNKYILFLKAPEVKLILNICISKHAKLQSVRNSIA